MGGLAGSGILIVASALIGGYLLGSIPFGLLLTRFAGLGDVRKIGSGNIGATNVLRTGRKGLAAATLVLDALKGTVAVLLAKLAGPEAALAAGFGAFIGHCYPVWLGFRGGKGVATFLGILFAFSWAVGLAFVGIWLAVAAATRISSLAGLAALVATPVILAWTGMGAVATLFAVLVALSAWRHRENIARLIAGKESRIGAKGG